MLPVVKGEEATRASILRYTVAVSVLATLMFVFVGSMGVIYLTTSLILGGVFTYYAWRLLREKHRGATLRLYKFSILYLALLFLVVMVDGAI